MADRELLLTLSEDQHRELAESVAELRATLGTPNATQTILEALRRARLEASERREAA